MWSPWTREQFPRTPGTTNNLVTRTNLDGKTCVKEAKCMFMLSFNRCFLFSLHAEAQILNNIRILLD